MHSHKVFLHRHIADAAKGDTEAQGILAATACDVINVKPLSIDGKSGLTVAERMELIMAFDLYLQALKKNTK